jgi:hypothetical protein
MRAQTDVARAHRMLAEAYEHMDPTKSSIATVRAHAALDILAWVLEESSAFARAYRTMCDTEDTVLGRALADAPAEGEPS